MRCTPGHSALRFAIMSGPASSGRSLLGAMRRGTVTADGGLGTRLLERGFGLDVVYEELAVSRPEVIAEIHEEYLRAGAGLIETATFGANSIRLQQRGHIHRARQINLAAARLARSVAGDRALVAGAIGPTGLPGAAIADEAVASRVSGAFAEQAAALVEGGVDGIVVETMTSLREAMMAVLAARQAIGDGSLILAHVVVDDRLLMPDGTKLADAGDWLVGMSCDIVGVNCCDPRVALVAAEELLRRDLKVSVMPSAGLPREAGGQPVYPFGSEDFGALARRLHVPGVVMMGGCCGTTPEHVTAIASALRGEA